MAKKHAPSNARPSLWNKRRKQIFWGVAVIVGFVAFALIQSHLERIPFFGPLVKVLSGKKPLFSLWRRQSIPDNPEERDLQVLQEWLIEGGSKIVPSLHIADASMDDVRGVYTTERLPYGTDVMVIPRNRLMLLEQCADYPVGRAYLDAARGDPDWIVQLAIVLLEEEKLGPQSKWYPYIKMLPKTLEYFPMFFPEQLLQDELRGSQVLPTLEYRRQSYRKYYQSVKDAYPPWDIDFDAFVRGILLVNSRNFGIQLDGQSTNALVPLADLLNHERPPAPTTWQFDEERGAFTVVVTKPGGIPALSAVHDSYGHRCNTRLFVGYGFTLRHNPDNKALVDGMHELMLGWHHKPTLQYLASMRQLVANRAGHTGKHDWSQKALSLELELAALQLARDGCQRSLSAFKTTWAEDLEKEKTFDTLSFNQRNILTMVMGEKRVLRWLIEQVDRVESMLKDSNNNAASLNRSLLKASDPLSPDYYVAKFLLPVMAKSSN